MLLLVFCEMTSWNESHFSKSHCFLYEMETNFRKIIFFPKKILLSFLQLKGVSNFAAFCQFNSPLKGQLERQKKRSQHIKVLVELPHSI